MYQGFALWHQAHCAPACHPTHPPQPPPCPPRTPAEGGTGEEGADPRAALVLQLLLASLEQPAPNLTHLLCGFDFDSGQGGVYLPDPRAQYNVLRVVLSAVLVRRAGSQEGWGRAGTEVGIQQISGSSSK